MSPATPRLPARSGVGLKAQHYVYILEQHPDIGWFEVHPENYMGDGGPPHRYLAEIRKDYPLSMHGVGMSLGSADGVDAAHLQELVRLVRRYQPEEISEHLAWSRFDTTYLNDLLPLPYNQESLRTVADNIDRVQQALERRILIENPSLYLEFTHGTCTETAFLTELARRTGCGILLDVNNVFVSASNLGFDPVDYIRNIPAELVGEIHLSGHAIQSIGETEIRIDDHGSPVPEPVLELYEVALRHLGRFIPTLIEWDNNIPEFNVLAAEAAKAEAVAGRVNREETHAATA